jgi:hypothetical protein
MRNNELMKKGGKWLSEARRFIQWNCLNGEKVIWGSQDLLNFKTGITVRQFEELAARIANKAINQYRNERNRGDKRLLTKMVEEIKRKEKE